MTHFLDDILRQPEELKRAFDYLCGAGQDTLQTATAAVRRAGTARDLGFFARLDKEGGGHMVVPQK